MRTIILLLLSVIGVAAQTPPIEPGVSHELAKWRAARYSDVRYKLNLTLEKMSPVLKGTMEIRVKVNTAPGEQGFVPWGVPIVLDWRKIRGSESLSTLSNASVNGENVTPLQGAGRVLDRAEPVYENRSEHLIFMDAVRPGENVIKLDFTSPILTSGSAITRYVDKEDGAEYIYSLFVPSDASTAFPVFDQPDLKARFSLRIQTPEGWKVISNEGGWTLNFNEAQGSHFWPGETKPISTYVFAFAAGPFERMSEPGAIATGFRPSGSTGDLTPEISKTNPPSVAKNPVAIAPGSDLSTAIFVRKSQAAKFKPHATEVFRLNREGIKFLEQYFDYKFPFPKYDLVLIPEFPFGGMEHAGATFLREASIIFPTEPTKSDHISRANLIFHEAAHQWFGDTVTMKWFDDLWLKEGFAEFMAYKTLERVMPDANAWKVFYERNKQAAYLTDSTRGTTPIYQEIANLNSAKSAYGNIVYRKAPSFLKQAEFYLGADKFQTAVRAFLKKYEYRNAEWTDLVKEFEQSSGQDLQSWANVWVKQRGLDVYRTTYDRESKTKSPLILSIVNRFAREGAIPQKLNLLWAYRDGNVEPKPVKVSPGTSAFKFGLDFPYTEQQFAFFFPNYQDHGYGIFLLDDKSRDYVLKNIQNEKDAFLRSMMWGALWDSVREGELDPAVYVELAIKQLGGPLPQATRSKGIAAPTETDETIVASLLGRVSTALNYYIPAPDTALANARASATNDQRSRFEAVLLDRLQNAPTAGQRITFYRSFVANASTAKGREVLKQMLEQAKQPTGGSLSLRTKDRFDIVQRLIILGDPDELKLLADLEKTETTDDAKRYAYAARAGIATAENKAKYWNDFTNNKDISESWIEAAFGPWNSIRHSSLTLPYLQKALQELPNHKRNRKIFFVNGWLGAFISGQRSEEALNIVNKFLADNPNLDRDLRLKILENVDLIERAVKIRGKYGR
ncbi:MAG: ERAP1-like C-terminal domain-containing protein [Acidobacteria bacterium]|nr:ERAP1-like C-terminal domain-containing protein [Acidobacteriota bacterium]MBP7476695.1 ERAP1-like C-terminal domain-containing protein [Pyrinomonadaceae bacterium]